MESIEISPTLLIVAGIICVFMGIIATLLLNTLREEEGVAQDDETPPGGKKGRYTPIVRLWRERGSGKLVVEVDGKSLVAPDPLNEIQRDRLEKVSRDFSTWLGIEMTGRPSAAVQTSQEPPPSLPSAAPVEQRYNPPAAKPPVPTDNLVMPAAGKSNYPPRQPAAKASAVPVPPVNGVVEPAAARTAKSIVMQIEDVLQEMLVGTTFANQGIHLNEDPTRGVIVSVGSSYYEGIDSVPDPEIKALIRSAVATWESRQ